MSKSDSVFSTIGGIPYPCLFLLCLAGVQSDIVLTQPKSVVAKPGQTHRLTCAVSGLNLNNVNMHWVKEVPGKGLKWLLWYYSETSKNYAPGVQSRFTASKGGSNFYVQMNNLRLDDTATYYCASDTVRDTGTGPGQKPSKITCPSGADGKGSSDRHSCTMAVLVHVRSSTQQKAGYQQRFSRRYADRWAEGLSGSHQSAAQSQEP